MNINDFLDFVDAIKNIEQYEKQVQTLKEENERLEKNIAATVKVGELSALLEKATKDAEEAAATLKAAKQEAISIKEVAKASYDKKEAAVALREVEIGVKLEKAQAALEQASKLNADTETRLTKELADVHARKTQLITANQEVAERLEKLKTVMGG